MVWNNNAIVCMSRVSNIVYGEKKTSLYLKYCIEILTSF